jgi:hypothetical protein
MNMAPRVSSEMGVMRYLHTKRYSKYGHNLFLEVITVPKLYKGTREIVVLDELYYKVVYAPHGKGKVKVMINVYGEDFYFLYIKGRGCRFYDAVEGDESPYVHNHLFTIGVKEFLQYLENFDVDLRFRLAFLSYRFKDRMSEECQEMITEVVNRI